MGQLNNLDWEHVDIAAVIAGIRGDGVLSGLAVSESSTPAMTVLVASGSCKISDVEYTESSGQNLNISNGDATHPRKDIVVYDATAGNPAVVEGTPAAAPISPDIPSGDIYLAMVHVAANETTSIVNADIDEGRIIVAYHHASHESGDDIVVRFSNNSGDISGSRALNTVYQNTTGKLMFVTVVGTHTTVANTLSGYTDSSTPPTTFVAVAFPCKDHRPISFFVQPNDYYKATLSSSGGTASLYAWFEAY